MFQGYILAIGAGFLNGGVFTSFQVWCWSSFLIFMPRFWGLIVLVGLSNGSSGLRRHFYLVCLMGWGVSYSWQLHDAAAGCGFDFVMVENHIHGW